MAQAESEMTEALSAHAARTFAAIRAPIGAWPVRAGASCMICAEAYTLREVAARLPCGHSFHSRCIMPYLRDVRYERECPVCGVNVPHTLAATRLALVNSHLQTTQYSTASSAACTPVVDEDVYEALSAALTASRYVTSAPTDAQTQTPPCDACNLQRAHTGALRELPCAHWICTDCDMHAHERCSICAALRVDGAQAIRWSVRHAAKRAYAVKRCTEIAAIRRGERADFSTVEAHYHVLHSLLTVTVPTIPTLDQLINATRHTLSLPRSNLSSLTLQQVFTPEAEYAIRETVNDVIELTADQAGDTVQNAVPVVASSGNDASTELRDRLDDNMAVVSSPVTTHDVEEHICVVCLSPLEVGCEALQLGCAHAFHFECISAYLRTAPRPQCPLCRIPVPRSSLDALSPFLWRCTI